MLDYQFSSMSGNQLEIIKAANKADSTILITGHSGTGKSHLAHVIHKATKRAANKFIKINLATLSENIIESELFGHEKGSFTGAETRRVGKLELCNGGTVFLDEIGELPVRLQTKLLDFIQYKKITPVGSNREIELDVRIIVATNKDLIEAVKQKLFREDLFYRLNVFRVQMSALNEIKGSIIPLAKRFLDKMNEQMEKNILGISSEVEQMFLSYNWPGNIRELQNVIEYAAAMEVNKFITVKSLPAQFEYLQGSSILNTNKEIVEDAEEIKDLENNLNIEQIKSDEECRSEYLKIPVRMNYHECKDIYEKKYLEQMLRMCKGKINLTSRTIGLNKVSLIEKIRKLNIDWKTYQDNRGVDQSHHELSLSV